jgi:hypothetical protein
VKSKIFKRPCGKGDSHGESDNKLIRKIVFNKNSSSRIVRCLMTDDKFSSEGGKLFKIQICFFYFTIFLSHANLHFLLKLYQLKFISNKVLRYRK